MTTILLFDGNVLTFQLIILKLYRVRVYYDQYGKRNGDKTAKKVMDFTKVSMSIFAYSFVNELSNSTKFSDIVAFLVQDFARFY